MSSAVEKDVRGGLDPRPGQPVSGALDSFERVIEPRGRRSLSPRLGEIWAYRELLFFLSWRDVKIRYKQTGLGVGWAVLQPFTLMIAFTLLFNRVAKVPTGGMPYPIFSYSALVPWTLFSSALTTVSTSLVSNSALISKIYFPRLVIPIAAVGSFVFDYVIALLLLFAMMVYYGIYPGWGIVALPVLTLLTLLTAFAVGVWLTALNVRYRDVKYVVPFLLQIWLFASPVAYAANLVPSKWRLVYSLNPMAGVINAYRWALLGQSWHPDRYFAISLAATLVILASGIVYFRATERTFADVI